jgi:hypothetical protein
MCTIPSEHSVTTQSDESFIVTMTLKLPEGETQRWHIRQDPLIGEE